MFDLTVLDYIYILVILASTVWATIRGGIYETIATLSWIVAAITARFTSPYLDTQLQKWFHLPDSTVVTLIASYFIVFFVILVIVGFINHKIRERIQDSFLSVTDRTLGVVFGIIRSVIVMGFVYWGMLWYYSDMPRGLPRWIADARTRPVMQLTASKMDDWFFFGNSKLLKQDLEQDRKQHKNLISPMVEKKKAEPIEEKKPTETGYKTSERAALENQLLQIESVANAIQKESK
ncbi:MAG: CvpA family protein [Alphaproteobacteria bacterium]|nr:CvpA family protein [Alphaproteobacteria bacterium]